MQAHRYAILPDVDLRVRGDRRALRHFSAEYGAARVGDDGSPVAVEVRFGRGLTQAAALDGGHKTVRWSVSVGSPRAVPLRMDIDLRGAPRAFGLSLVQGYFVEPLLSVAAARAGHVLLPAAAIGQGEGILVLLGASGTGKSSLSARALAAGDGVLGDDQILLDAGGRCTRFPRRMRFYSDLRLTAPAAWARLPAPARAGLQTRRAVRALSRDFVAPSLALAPSKIGDAGPAGPSPATRIVLLERSPEAAVLRHERVDADVATAHALAVLEAQRERFAACADGAWLQELAGVRIRERRMLESAFASAPLERFEVPGAWSAPRAITALAADLGIAR
ncbi:MAG: hypothetical protein JWO02_2703 [Solirubrobacterales bacterium]|nr:hypothetical protein [Solirubrobacterales bacterium]